VGSGDNTGLTSGEPRWACHEPSSQDGPALMKLNFSAKDAP
jgi:hypothetical protein